MELTEIFKKIYSGDMVKRKHITLFSLSGIFALLLNSVLSYFGNNLLSSMPTISPSDLEVRIYLGFLIYFWAYLFGYEYKFIHKIMNDSSIAIPCFDRQVLDVFFKVLPLFLLWQVYFFAVSYFTAKFTITTSSLFCYFFFGTIMMVFTPFVFMIYAKFAKDFKYTRDVIYPWAIIKYIDRGLVDIVVLGVKYLIFAIIPVAFFIGYFDWISGFSEQSVRLIGYLFGISFAAYIFIIFKLVYAVAVAQIVKEKVLND